MVVHFDQCQHSLLHRRQLQQCHLAVLAVMGIEFTILIGHLSLSLSFSVYLREKFECFDFEIIGGEGFFDVILSAG